MKTNESTKIAGPRTRASRRIRHAALPLLLFGALAQGVRAQVDVEVVRLLVGEEVVVVLDRDSFDEVAGIDARRVEDDARLHLQWGQMHPDDAARIRASFGFFSDEPEPVMIEAERFYFGGGTSFVGVIESQTPSEFTLRYLGKTSTFSWDGVRRREPVRVDALEVFDAETLYTDEFARRPPQTALEHYNLALYCEGIEAWQHVVEHLTEARSLDPDLKRNTLENKRKRAEARIAAGEDADLLQDAERLAAHDAFDQALAKIENFLAANPGSALRSDFERSRQKILAKRGRWLMAKGPSEVFNQLDRIFRDLASAEAVTITDARKEVDRNASKLALEAAAERLEVPLDEITQVWQSEDRPKGSPRTASYGAGTFTLGEQAVFDGMEKQNPDEKDAAKKDEGGGAGETNDVQERIKRILEERQRRKEEQARGGPQRKNSFQIADVGPNKDEWWDKVATSQEKRSYLMAYWAERDENVRKLGVSPRSCARCGGAGEFRSFTNAGADMVQPCDRCKGLRIDRIVRFQ